MIKFLFLMLLCSTAFAEAPCMPTDPMFHDGPTIRTADGACQVWFCSNDHHWDKYWLCATWSEITGASIDHIRALIAGAKTQRDTEWDAITAPPAPGSAYDRLTQAAKVVPRPQDVPIDGLVTGDRNAYKLTSPTNAAPVFQLAGSVPVGTPCDSTQKLGKYYRVDRTKVVIPKGALLAPAYYALCDP